MSTEEQIAHMEALDDLRQCASESFAIEQSKLDPEQWTAAISAAKDAFEANARLRATLEIARKAMKSAIDRCCVPVAEAIDASPKDNGRRLAVFDAIDIPLARVTIELDRTDAHHAAIAHLESVAPE